ncbi:hypothetical protein FHX82_002642 [Amycolatopsis bartoniae]|uniref:hypothetical protein n=1 Tax=Amycolatopsis bartoniae TaxID=941986 RepID=UPI0011950ED1|nr:hypothetical protein [Amycolatopsis bartoniae]MBB2935588.1 hypothetical protein [Amycolatopsis bartoniae]TVT05229.1 hypothetical protein FNH07_23030 [Amycolatopsis bartoniae]
MLWTGESPRSAAWKAWLRRLLGLAIMAGLLILLRYLLGQPDYLLQGAIQAAAIFLFNSLINPFMFRNQLTEGRYTVTNQRVLVENRVYWFRIRRSERLAALAPPRLLDDGSVSFGNPRKGVLAGHRPNGLVIFELTLRGIPEPERVLEIVREAHRQAR